MRYARRNEEQAAGRERKIRHNLGIAAALFGLAFLLLAAVRARDYKKVILTYEERTELAVSEPDSSRIVRLIGRPDRPYYRLPKRPRYKHFWE